MPELGLERLGELHPDGDGYIRDPGGYILGRLHKDKIQWFQSDNESRIYAKLEDVEAVERSTEPHAYTVTYTDGASAPIFGSMEKSDVPVMIPERTGSPILDMDAVMEYCCPQLRNQVFTDYLSGYRFVDVGRLGVKPNPYQEEDAPEKETAAQSSQKPYIMTDGSYLASLSEAVITVRRCIARWSMSIPGWGRPFTPSKDDAKAWLLDMSRDRVRNFFLENIRNNMTVMQSRMEDGAYSLFRNLGMTAPGLTDEEEEHYLEWVCRAYLLATIERQLHPTKVQMALCIYGNEGTGKSTTFEFLGGRWYRQTNTSVKNQQKFMESVNGGAIVEFNDNDQHATHPGDFKGFIDRKQMQYRRPYDDMDRLYTIPFVTVITTNDHHPIVNLTGSRRILPICLDRQMEQDLTKTPESCMIAVWVRAYRDYMNGCRWDDGIEEIIPLSKKMQEHAAKDNPNEDVLREVLELYGTELGAKIPLRGLKEELNQRLYNLNDVNATLDMLKTYPERFGLIEKPFKDPLTRTTTRGFVRIRPAE